MDASIRKVKEQLVLELEEQKKAYYRAYDILIDQAFWAKQEKRQLVKENFAGYAQAAQTYGQILESLVKRGDGEEIFFTSHPECQLLSEKCKNRAYQIAIQKMPKHGEAIKILITDKFPSPLSINRTALLYPFETEQQLVDFIKDDPNLKNPWSKILLAEKGFTLEAAKQKTPEYWEKRNQAASIILESLKDIFESL